MYVLVHYTVHVQIVFMMILLIFKHKSQTSWIFLCPVLTKTEKIFAQISVAKNSRILPILNGFLMKDIINLIIFLQKWSSNCESLKTSQVGNYLGAGAVANLDAAFT